LTPYTKGLRYPRPRAILKRALTYAQATFFQSSVGVRSGCNAAAATRTAGSDARRLEDGGCACHRCGRVVLHLRLPGRPPCCSALGRALLHRRRAEVPARRLLPGSASAARQAADRGGRAARRPEPLDRRLPQRHLLRGGDSARVLVLRLPADSGDAGVADG